MKKTLPKTKYTVKKLILGNKGKNGLFRMVPFYFMMICAGFIFLYPLFFDVERYMATPEYQ